MGDKEEIIVTREQVEQRLAALKAGLEEAKANLSATLGAIQESEYWLEQMKKK
jgi:hypothetical protein